MAGARRWRRGEGYARVHGEVEQHQNLRGGKEHPPTHLVTLEPPLFAGSIHDKANSDPETTATPTERGGDGARAAVIPTNVAVRA